VPVNLICATRGEAGWMGKPRGAVEEDLAQIRAAELEEAAAALAIGGVELWDYPDGGVSGIDAQGVTQRIWEQISKLHPKAVITFGPDGVYGHPDHIAIGACTDSAVNAHVRGRSSSDLPPCRRRSAHRTSTARPCACRGTESAHFPWS